MSNQLKYNFLQLLPGVVVLFAAFEQGSERFRQDKTFYYYTGVNEPGTALVIDLKGKSTLYIPNCFEKRAQWMTLPEALIKRDAKALNVDAVELLGDECEGYELNPYFSAHEYAHMITLLEDVIKHVVDQYLLLHQIMVMNMLIHDLFWIIYKNLFQKFSTQFLIFQRLSHRADVAKT